MSRRAIAGHHLVGIGEDVTVRLHQGQRERSGTGEQITTQHHIRPPGGNADRLDLFGAFGQPDMRGDRAALLRQTRHVDQPGPFAL